LSWKRFERLVAAIHHALPEGNEVRWNDSIGGRQFDVTIRFKSGIYDYLCVIECKDYSRRVPVEKVDAFVTKAQNAKAHRAVMVSANGYQSGCVDVAKKHDIKLLTLSEVLNCNYDHFIKELIPALNVFSVKLVEASSGAEHELDESGGRLSYLMSHIKFIGSEGVSTPDDIIADWQVSNPAIDFKKDNHVEINFKNGTIADIPYETEIEVSALRFQCCLVEAMIPNQPILDNHVMAALHTNVELHDEDGVLIHATELSNIPLGYDMKVEPGKFYVIPSLDYYYFCESIEGDWISWVLVESYQHGQLVRARGKQEIKYSEHYVEVTDTKILSRLLLLLDDYNAQKGEVGTDTH
jgi:hypothetical protein